MVYISRRKAIGGYRQDELQQLRVVEVAYGLPQISHSDTYAYKYR